MRIEGSSDDRHSALPRMHGVRGFRASASDSGTPTPGHPGSPPCGVLRGAAVRPHAELHSPRRCRWMWQNTEHGEH
jgi:hypothetical protein